MSYSATCMEVVLKDSPLRSVRRVAHADTDVTRVIKEYRVRGFLERVRAAWLRSRAKVEFENLATARARGLPCPRPLGFKVERKLLPRLGMLELEDLGAGATLDHVLEGHADLGLCARAGQLIARAFASGLEHRDLHLGNLFLAVDGTLHLLDLHSAHFHTGSVRPRSRHVRSLCLSLPWPEQRRLLEALLEPLEVVPPPEEVAAQLRTHLRRRLGRAVRSSGDFLVEGDGNDRWLARRGHAGTPDQWRAEVAAGRTVKEGRRGAVVEISDGVAFAKLRDEAAACRLWLAAEALALRKIPHPRTLAWFRGPAERWWVMATACRGRPLSNADPTDARALVADLAKSVARLHATGWRCRDLKADNLLALEGRVHFVDLDGVRPMTMLGRRRAMAGDLSRLPAWARFQAPENIRPLVPGLARRFLVHYLRCLTTLGAPLRRIDAFLEEVEGRCSAWQRRHRP